MDRDAASQRDVSEDLVPGHGLAAAGQADEHVRDAVDREAQIRGGLGGARTQSAALLEIGRGVLLCVDPLPGLEARDDLVDHGLDGRATGPDGDVELLRLPEPHLLDDLVKERRAGDLLIGQTRLAQMLVEEVAALVFRVVALLTAEERADLGARLAGADEVQPVAGRAAGGLAGEDLDEVPRAEAVRERHDAPVDTRPDRAVADIGVDGVGEVDRRGTGRQLADLALRREDVDGVLVEVGAEGVHELTRVARVLLPLHHVPDPRRGVLAGRLVLVEPVRRDAELRDAVHLGSADLDLERVTAGPDHGGVEGLIPVELGHRDVVLEPARHRLPQRVDDADGAVAVLHRVHDHAQCREVVDLVELLALDGHLLVDGVDVLRPSGDLDGHDADVLELAIEERSRVGDHGVAVGAALVDELLDLGVAAGMERGEGEVLEFRLERVDTEAVRERCVDLEGLARLLDALVLAHVAERAHVVQPVGELHHEDAEITRHRDDELAVVLGLVLLLALEVDLRELGDTVHQCGDVRTEQGLHLVEAGLRVLHGVVHQSGLDGLRVRPELGADHGAPDGMRDERLSGAAELTAMMLLGERVRAPDGVRVDIAVVTPDLVDHIVDGGRVDGFTVCEEFGHPSQDIAALKKAKPSTSERNARAPSRHSETERAVGASSSLAGGASATPRTPSVVISRRPISPSARSARSIRRTDTSAEGAPRSAWSRSLSHGW